MERSPIHNIWGDLFDEKDGMPTERLYQFLRGLANIIVQANSVKK